MRTAPTALDAPTGLHPRTAYFGALLLATLLPLLSLPLMAAAELPFDSSLLLGIAIFAGGAGHVASTACIYADPRVRATVAPMKGRFYALPIAVIALSVLAYVGARSFDVDDGAVAGIFLFHLLWLYYHYQKQNYGLVAFSAAGAGRRVPRVLAPVLLLPALAGSAATLPALLADGLPYATFLEPYAALLRRGGLVLYGLGACALVVLIARHRQSFADLRTVIFTATAFCFFLPAFLLQDTNYAFWSYALAHGFQYLIMVYTVAGGAQRVLRTLAVFVPSVAGGGWLLSSLGGTDALFVAGIVLTWVHFVLDAKLWRMSEAGPRQLLKERFGFLFA